MRDPERIYKVLGLLGRVWGENPDLRLGQLLISAAYHSGWNQADIFHLEDDQLAEGLEKMLKEIDG